MKKTGYIYYIIICALSLVPSLALATPASHMYFNSAANNEWYNLLNWWDDAAFTIQSTEFPGTTTDVDISGTISSQTGPNPHIRNLSLSGTISNLTLFASGTATFLSSSATDNTNNIYADNIVVDGSGVDAILHGSTTVMNGGSTGSSIYGNIVFLDTSTNNGVLYGESVFRNNSQNASQTYATTTFRESSRNDSSGVIDALALFYNDSINTGFLESIVHFHDNSINNGTINGGETRFFDNSLHNNGSVNSDVYFYDNSSFAGRASLNGVTNRIYRTLTDSTHNFLGIGAPWTVIADGINAVVNIAQAIYDSNTVFLEQSGGTFINDSTEPVISDIVITPSDTSVHISWTTDEIANSYIYVSTSSSVYGDPIDVATSTMNHQITITNLSPNTQYYFQIEAIDRFSLLTTSPEISTSTTPLVITSTGNTLEPGTLTRMSGTSYIINSTTEIGLNTPIIPRATDQSTSSPLSPIQTLYYTQRNEDIRQLQKALNKLGFTVSVSGAGSPGKETNFFGPATYKAVKEYQRAFGIRQTGNFGPITRQSMLNTLDRIK